MDLGGEKAGYPMDMPLVHMVPWVMRYLCIVV